MKVIVLHTDVSNYHYQGYSSWKRTEFSRLSDAIDFSYGLEWKDFCSFIGFLDDGELTVLKHEVQIETTLSETLSEEVSSHFHNAFNLPIA